MARTKTNSSKDSTATIGFDVSVPVRKDLAVDTATPVSAKLRPRNHSAGLLRSERQLLANPPFNDFDTALRDSARHDCEAYPQVIRGAKDSWSKDDVRWQWSGATWTTRNGCPEDERGGVHQFGVPPKGNANFAFAPESWASRLTPLRPA